MPTTTFHANWPCLKPRAWAGCLWSWGLLARERRERHRGAGGGDASAGGGGVAGGVILALLALGLCDFLVVHYLLSVDIRFMSFLGVIRGLS